METRSIFKNISPIDHRYSLPQGGLYDELSVFLSEEAGIVYCAMAEMALVKAHLKIAEEKKGSLLPKLSGELEKTLDDIALNIDPSEVYEEEHKTQHNIRALVNDKGQRVKKATPSTPVEILGLNEVPMAGDQFVVMPSEKAARTIGEKRRIKQRDEQMKATSKITLEEPATSSLQGNRYISLNELDPVFTVSFTPSRPFAVFTFTTSDLLTECVSFRKSPNAIKKSVHVS